MSTYTKQVDDASASSPYKTLDLVGIFIEQISHRKKRARSLAMGLRL